MVLIEPGVMTAVPAAILPASRGFRFGREIAAFPARADHATIKISPEGVVDRRTFDLDGMTFEIVQSKRREKVEFRYCGTRHLLAVCEQGGRTHGDTFVGGLPPSSLRDINRRLTFVPAGQDYYEWQQPRTPSRVIYFYFDPTRMPADSARSNFAPRLFFRDPGLWETAVKLSRLAEGAGSDNRLYLEALGTILTHELARLNSRSPAIRVPIRGGLASWQERLVATYIEEHLAEHIALPTLAGLVRLSPCYFCRAFKESFGISPHRYHTKRRVEHAKSLLARPDLSVTDIGLTVGFSETSSFSTAFRRVTGLSPTDYRRSCEHEYA
jgi:AraC family transcriptional regulator